MKKRTSPIWKIDTTLLEKLTLKATTYSEILKYFNLNNKGGNCKTLKERLDYEDIDYSHIPYGKGSNRNRPKGGVKKTLLKDILVENSSWTSTHRLKLRLWEENIKQKICEICGMGGIWNGMPLSLQLDHINGIRKDNREENLRILCPNCHSQTDNFAGKKNKKIKHCERCNIILNKSNKYCVTCLNIVQRKDKINRRKFNPTVGELTQCIIKLNYNICAVGRFYNVSDNAIRKKCKKLNILYKK